jgi:hypothetical protein
VSGGALQAGTAWFDSTGLGAYSTGGAITPNPRNIAINLTDYPDSYQIIFVNPPQQTVQVTVTWNTSSLNFVSPAAVAQLAGPALADYVNSIIVGKPMSQYTMEDVFADAVEPVLPRELISLIQFAVSLNNIPTPVTPGTGYFEGDPQSFFYCTPSNFTFIQG